MRRSRIAGGAAMVAMATLILSTSGTAANAFALAAQQTAAETEATLTVQAQDLADDGVVFETENIILIVEEQSSPREGEMAFQSSRAPQAAAARYVKCDLNVQYPHGSSHVRGTINQVNVASCEVATPIRLHTSLIRLAPRYQQWHAPIKMEKAKVVKSNRAVSCSEGGARFRGWGSASITPPPGYTLVGPATVKKYGAIRSITCGVTPALAGEIAETMTITFERSDLVR